MCWYAKKKSGYDTIVLYDNGAVVETTLQNWVKAFFIIFEHFKPFWLNINWDCSSLVPILVFLGANRDVVVSAKNQPSQSSAYIARNAK